MDVRFFNAAGAALFERNDMESGTWNVEELNLQATFPYNAEKVIERGMRVGFTDVTGAFQLFEIRQAKIYQPDMYQEITAEHIAIAELSDEIFPGAVWENVTAGVALAAVLTGTLWAVGTNTASNTSSADSTISTAYQNIRTIEDNWNVIITPRITVNASGITHRYLDIAPAGGTFRGLRLSVDKNADELGVTWDDTKLKTALYGFGAQVDVEGGEPNEKTPLTFKDVVWTATSAHPAKPANQEYIEDPSATAAYGRNGRARFGFYQNSSIDDAETLLEKTWETLQTVELPDITIDCMVRDLHRLGYGDTPLALHDVAQVEIIGTGVVLQKEITRLSVDLLDPTATRVTIGTYIPNIVYYTKQTNDAATGGGGGGGGSGGKTPEENERIEFRTTMESNGREITLMSEQLDYNSEVLRMAGISINEQGVLVYSTDYEYNIMSKLNVQADRISLVVSGTGANATIKAAEILAAINDDGTSQIVLSADKIDINGLVSSLRTVALEVSELTTNNITVAHRTDFLEGIDAGTYIAAGTGFMVGSDTRTATWQSKTFTTYRLSSKNYFLIAQSNGSTTPIGTVQGNLVIGTGSTTIYYLGSSSAS